jgi:hypothetical protein
MIVTGLQGGVTAKRVRNDDGRHGRIEQATGLRYREGFARMLRDGIAFPPR